MIENMRSSFSAEVAASPLAGQSGLLVGQGHVAAQRNSFESPKMTALDLEGRRLAPSRKADDMAAQPLWAGCRQSTIDLLLRRSVRRKFSSRSVIVDEGAPADFLHVVLSGSIELFARYRRQETEFSLVEAPHAFIVAAVIANRAYLTSARVLQPAEILMIHAESVRGAFNHDAEFARRVAVELAHSYRAVAQELKSQTLLTAVERLANWLLERDAETGGRHLFAIPFDKRTLAARLGMVPEVLSRTLATLGKYGVDVRGAAIEIRDPLALGRLARPEPLFRDFRRARITPRCIALTIVKAGMVRTGHGNGGRGFGQTAPSVREFGLLNKIVE